MKVLTIKDKNNNRFIFNPLLIAGVFEQEKGRLNVYIINDRIPFSIVYDYDKFVDRWEAALK